MIPKDNLETLIDIEKQIPVAISDLLSTYTRKEMQYYTRETGNILIQVVDSKFGKRAIDVMEYYAYKKLGYKPKIDYNDFHAW